MAYTLTQPGAPLLYYGDEIGLHGGGDPDNRRLMNFDPFLSANQTELRDRVRAIGQARVAHPALRRGERRQLWVDDDLVVYSLSTGEQVAVVAVHKGWTERTETVSIDGLGVDGATFDDSVWGRNFTASGSDLTLTLGSWDYALLVAR